MQIKRLILPLLACCAGVIAVAHFMQSQIQHDQRPFREQVMREAITDFYHYSKDSGSVMSQFTVDDQGKPLCSWRFVLRPHMDTANLPGRDYTKPWNAPQNIQWEYTAFACFCMRPRNVYTNVVAVAGEGTAFDDSVMRPIESLPDDLILLVEVRDSAIHWMEPRDFDIQSMPREIAGEGLCISGMDGDGFLVAFADKSVWLLDNRTPFETVSCFFTVEGADAHDRRELLAFYRLAIE